MKKIQSVGINKLFVCFLVFIFTLSLVSCGFDKPGAVSSDVASPAETVSSAIASPAVSVSSVIASPAIAVASAAASPAAAVSHGADALIVLFIGNSLTYMSRIPQKLESIALSKGSDIDVRQVIHGGYKLSEHLQDFKDKDYFSRSNITEADIIIFQEAAKHQYDTVDVITEFQELFGSDKQFYFLETEYHNFVGAERNELKNIQFIRSGFAHDQLMQNGTLRYSDLHLKDMHPNDLYGYVAAFTVYCKINNLSCSDFTAEEMYNLIGEDKIPGDTAEIKNDVVLKIQEAVNAALEAE